MAGLRIPPNGFQGQAQQTAAGNVTISRLQSRNGMVPRRRKNGKKKSVKRAKRRTATKSVKRRTRTSARRLVKGSAAARRYMASLRAKRANGKGGRRK